MYEVKTLLDVRNRKKTRFDRRVREFLMWTGYTEPTWLAQEDINCGALIVDFEQRRTQRDRLLAMQAEEIA